MQPAISVIIPVYNAAPYLMECLDSVSSQTMRDMEIILVDDGSTDGSGEMACRWTRLHPEARYARQANGGASSARNAGITMASGRWIAFVDADDVLPPYSLETLLHMAESAPGIDMAVGTYSMFSRKAPLGIAATKVDVECISAEEMAVRMLYRENDCNSGPCGKLFRRDIFAGGDMAFREGILYEDLELLARMYLSDRCRRVAVTDTPVYFYRRYPGSSTGRFSERRMDVLDVTDAIMARCGRLSPLLAGAASDRALSARFDMFRLLCRNGRGHDEQADRCWRDIRRLRRRCLTDGRSRIKVRVAALASYAGRVLLTFIIRIGR